MLKCVETRELTWLTTDSGWIELNFFYKFQYEFIFNPIHLEPDSPELNLW